MSSRHRYLSSVYDATRVTYIYPYSPNHPPVFSVVTANVQASARPMIGNSLTVLRKCAEKSLS
ncbi:hypothetical protein PAXRUDRAFT_826114 [Paxillus rubicundulus Ve08.2h10]|uniref:Uncharacterized protein n=1 Tax=Paxillus rubicundulus Ve08.2h10 TaxID=930991 RepID=A0A0D0DZW9_9AGAM|nr:hypothetical protein PAXRUDRAFT_826114 [Paxillus rubicundulus Ve08.2h10]